jgi:hypothetical protein
VTDWLRGQGSALKNIGDWVVDLGLAFIWLGIDELGAWAPLPPLPFYPPRPPWADIPEGGIGDLAVGISNAIALVSNAIWNIWEPIKAVGDSGVGFVSGILDSLAFIPFVPLINFELNAGWDLIATEGDAITGLAHDLINAGYQFIVDTIHGGGLIAATINALNTTLASIGARGGQAIQALVDWGLAQVDFLVDFLTPGANSVSTAQLATATDSVGVPAAAAKTFAVGDDGPTSSDNPAARVVPDDGDTAGDTTPGSDADAADDTVVGTETGAADDTVVGTEAGAADDTVVGTDTDAAVPDKTEIVAPREDSTDLTTGSPNATTGSGAKNAGNGDPDSTADKPGANAQKTADKNGADAQGSNKKTEANAGHE